MLEVTSQPALIIDNSTNRISWNGRFNLKHFKIFFEIKRNTLEQVFDVCINSQAMNIHQKEEIQAN